MIKLFNLATAFLLLAVQVAVAQELTREEKVPADKAKVEADGFWIYNDLPRAYAEAEASGDQISVKLLHENKTRVLRLPIQE